MKEKIQGLGQLLRRLRKQNGYSQAEVARFLHISRPAYTYYETGKTTPDLSGIRLLAELYHISVERLIYPECSATPPNNSNKTEIPN